MEVAGTDSGRTRDGPGSAVDHAAREVNVSAAVHRGLDLLPAMATTLLARIDAEGRVTDGWDRHSVQAVLDIVAGMVPMAEDHFRVDPGLPVVVGLVVDGLAVETEDLRDQRDPVAAADPFVALVGTGGHRSVVGRVVGNSQGSGLVHQVGTATGRERSNPEVEDDTVAGSPSDVGDCRDGVVEPIPADEHRTVAAAVQTGAAVVAVTVGRIVVPAIGPDLVAEAAAVGLGRNCWDNDAGHAVVVVDAIATTNSMSVWDLAPAVVPDVLDAAVVVPVPALACIAVVVAYSEESWSRVCH